MLDKKCTSKPDDADAQCDKLNKAKNVARAEFDKLKLKVADEDNDGDVEVVESTSRRWAAKSSSWVAWTKNQTAKYWTIVQPFALPVLAVSAAVGAAAYYFWPSKKSQTVSDGPVDETPETTVKTVESDSKQGQEESGTCSIAGHSTQGACENAGGKWTPNSQKQTASAANVSSTKKELKDENKTKKSGSSPFLFYGGLALFAVVLIGVFFYLFVGKDESSDEHDIENPRPSDY